MILNRRDKEQLVVKLYQEGKSIREIAQQARLSFTDIGAIIRKIDGRDNDDGIGANKDIRNKTRETKALWLFSNGKKPIEVAVELDFDSFGCPKYFRGILDFERSARVGICLR